jgi:hypothetical protein
MTIAFNDRSRLRMIWIEYDRDVYFFNSSNTPKNKSTSSLAFDLSEDFGSYKDIEVVILEHNGEIVFKSDCFEDKTEEFTLRIFPTEEEDILLFENNLHRIYFHLT